MRIKMSRTGKGAKLITQQKRVDTMQSHILFSIHS